MTKQKRSLTVVMALLAGIVGGIISNQIFGCAFAEKKASHQNVIRAQRFEVIDENGKLKAVMQSKEGAGSLGFYDEMDVSRVVLGVVENGASLSIRGPKLKSGVVLNASEAFCSMIIKKNDTAINFHADEKERMISFFEPESKERLLLGIQEETPYIGFADSSQNRRLSLGLSPFDQSGIIAMIDENGNGLMSLQENDLSFFDKDFNDIWSAP